MLSHEKVEWEESYFAGCNRLHLVYGAGAIGSSYYPSYRCPEGC